MQPYREIESYFRLLTDNEKKKETVRKIFQNFKRVFLDETTVVSFLYWYVTREKKENVTVALS